MEKAAIVKDMKSFECSSPSEFDRNFFGEQSLLSALSLEQLSTSKASNEAMADSRASILASFCLALDTVSPCRGFESQELEGGGSLAVPQQGKFSTPQILNEKTKGGTAVFDRSYADLTPSHISWDLSLIKAESNSPRINALEQTWSPNLTRSLQVSPAFGQNAPQT
ncbi:uncharacterized protein ACNS7B_006137 [Menidia menidia]